MAKKNTKKPKSTSSTIALNKRARHEYHFEEKIEAGLALQGWEVKAIREGKVNLSESYVFLKDNEAYLFCTINPLKTTSTHVVADPMRYRKLLMKRRELDRLIGLTERQGQTLIPTAMYWKKAWVKVEVAVAQGKQLHDKRADSKNRDWEREKSRVMKGSLR
jgi:SsrA-binding protein